MKVLLYVLYMEEKVLYMEEKVNRYKDTSRHKVYVDAAQQERKLTNLGASSATTNLDQK